MLELRFYDRHMMTRSIQRVLEKHGLWDEGKLRLIVAAPIRGRRLRIKEDPFCREEGLLHVPELDGEDEAAVLAAMFAFAGRADFAEVCFGEQRYLLGAQYSRFDVDDGPAPSLAPGRLEGRLYMFRDLTGRQLELLDRAGIDIARLGALLLFDAKKNRLVVDEKQANPPFLTGGRMGPWKAAAMISHMLCVLSGEAALRVIRVGKKEYIAGAMYERSSVSVQLVRVGVSEQQEEEGFLF